MLKTLTNLWIAVTAVACIALVACIPAKNDDDSVPGGIGQLGDTSCVGDH